MKVFEKTKHKTMKRVNGNRNMLIFSKSNTIILYNIIVIVTMMSQNSLSMATRVKKLVDDLQVEFS